MPENIGVILPELAMSGDVQQPALRPLLAQHLLVGRGAYKQFRAGHDLRHCANFVQNQRSTASCNSQHQRRAGRVRALRLAARNMALKARNKL